MEEKLYYIQDLRSYVGNAINWWAEGDRGYTCNIDKAAKKKQGEALKLVEGSDKYRAWPVEYIDGLKEGTFRIVDMQYPDIKKGNAILNPDEKKTRRIS